MPPLNRGDMWDHARAYSDAAMRRLAYPGSAIGVKPDIGPLAVPVRV